ncbi:MAG: hypothetical protein AAFV80_00735, partial [Bacteroidota bacterium]
MNNLVKLCFCCLLILGMASCSNNDDVGPDNGYTGSGSISDEADCEYLKARLGTNWTFKATTNIGGGFPAQTQSFTSVIEADTIYDNQY